LSTIVHEEEMLIMKELWELSDQILDSSCEEMRHLPYVTRDLCSCRNHCTYSEAPYSKFYLVAGTKSRCLYCKLEQ